MVLSVLNTTESPGGYAGYAVLGFAADAECQCRGLRCRRSRGCNYANCPEGLLRQDAEGVRRPDYGQWLPVTSLTEHL
jgi:hypothetical protein